MAEDHEPTVLVAFGLGTKGIDVEQAWQGSRPCSPCCDSIGIPLCWCLHICTKDNGRSEGEGGDEVSKTKRRGKMVKAVRGKRADCWKHFKVINVPSKKEGGVMNCGTDK
ncbi:hypothetical protein E2562_034130 [Oryza meyeriana var. granulata]|uniref:Uncharacterized protein n=1 Tax=Oryza meyeriana var. granulata TaxID=110450 RepID=A0A6G1E721_9ORYZ|nr:hypothetical protein E2562_034130 [Oryza meyeriana var. granulata]